MSIYDISFLDKQGQQTTLRPFKGKVLLIVNTATHCGFTKQYASLEEIYQQYRDRGLVVIDFPCNQFGEQAPGNAEEIDSFCDINFHTTFPRFAKLEVNGDNEAPLYTYLKQEKGGLLGSKIKWNFTKFLVDREGVVIDRFAPAQDPEGFTKEIEALL